MMRGVGAGMPIKAVGRHAAAEPDVVHLPGRRGEADQDRRDQGQPHRHHRRRRQPRDLHRLHGQAEHAGERRAADHRRQPGGEGAGGAQQAGRRAARLLHGSGPAHAAADRREDGLDAALRHGRRHDALSSAIIVNNDWLKDAKNQDQLRRFLRASQRGWEYTDKHRDEAAEIFMQARARPSTRRSRCSRSTAR